MTDEQLCDQLTCLEPATVYIGVKVNNHLAYGHFSCDEHQADAFWQVTKVGLRQPGHFDVVLMPADNAEVI